MAVLRLFAQAREAAGTGRDVVDGATVDEVLAQARARYGAGFAALLGSCRVWVNGEPAARRRSGRATTTRWPCCRRCRAARRDRRGAPSPTSRGLAAPNRPVGTDRRADERRSRAAGNGDAGVAPTDASGERGGIARSGQRDHLDRRRRRPTVGAMPPIAGPAGADRGPIPRRRPRPPTGPAAPERPAAARPPSSAGPPVDPPPRQSFVPAARGAARRSRTSSWARPSAPPPATGRPGARRARAAPAPTRCRPGLPPADRPARPRGAPHRPRAGWPSSTTSRGPASGSAWPGSSGPSPPRCSAPSPPPSSTPSPRGSPPARSCGPGAPCPGRPTSAAGIAARPRAPAAVAGVPVAVGAAVLGVGGQRRRGLAPDGARLARGGGPGGRGRHHVLAAGARARAACVVLVRAESVIAAVVLLVRGQRLRGRATTSSGPAPPTPSRARSPASPPPRCWRCRWRWCWSSRSTTRGVALLVLRRRRLPARADRRVGRPARARGATPRRCGASTRCCVLAPLWAAAAGVF